MKKITCDKCGKVSDEIFASKYVDCPTDKNNYEEYDLCEKCSKEWDKLDDETFLKWLKGTLTSTSEVVEAYTKGFDAGVNAAKEDK